MDASLIMKRELTKTTAVLGLAVVFLFCTNSIAQILPTRLALNTPVSGEIKDEEINSYTVTLLAGQTARRDGSGWH